MKGCSQQSPPVTDAESDGYPAGDRPLIKTVPSFCSLARFNSSTAEPIMALGSAGTRVKLSKSGKGVYWFLLIRALNAMGDKSAMHNTFSSMLLQ